VINSFVSMLFDGFCGGGLSATARVREKKRYGSHSVLGIHPMSLVGFDLQKELLLGEKIGRKRHGDFLDRLATI